MVGCSSTMVAQVKGDGGLRKKGVESTRAPRLETRVSQLKKEPSQGSLDQVNLPKGFDGWCKPSKIARVKSLL